jgi:TolA-binding protein
MRFDQFPAARVAIVGAAILPAIAGTPVSAQAPAPPVQQTIDAQLMSRGMELFNAGNFAEATKSFEAIPQQVPTSPFIPEATFRAGLCYYNAGDYDKAVQFFEKVPTLKNVQPEIMELASQYIPQVTAVKASKLPPEDPNRRGAYEDAIRQFDQFLSKFPQSAEVESANYWKAIALHQVERFEDAATALKTNLQRFPQSPSIMDSQYLLALTLGTLANKTLQTATAKDQSAAANYAEAEKLLNDIINKRSDYALANDARFQIGELAFVRGGFAGAAEKKALFQKALDNYRVVVPKDLVIQAQKARIEQIKQAGIAMGRQGDVNGFKRSQRLIEKERDKLAQFETRGDQTFTAKLRMGQIFFQLGKGDEARTVFNTIKNHAEEADAKKQIAYFTALAYAVQNVDLNGKNPKLAAKAEEAYKAFKAEHKNEKIGENLAIVLGSGFIETEPDKAINYFKESLADYPEGRFRQEALTQQAAALTKLQRYDEALDLYRKTLASSNSKELSASAEFGIGDIQRQTGKPAEAIATFKNVRDKYEATAQAPSAAYWIGAIALEMGDAKTAVAELENFVKKFPNSDLIAQGTFMLGNAQRAAGMKDAAIATYKAVAEKHGDSAVAPFSYFQRGDILNQDGKQEEVVTLMREFIQKYPDSGDALYQAYDFIAQVYAAQMKPAEAVATYEDFVAKNPQHPAAPAALLKVANGFIKAADGLGRYVALNEEKKAEWVKYVDSSMKTAERVLAEYPESPEVALALKNLLDAMKMRQQGKLITEEEVQQYFQEYAKKYESNPSTRSKIIFTLAAYTFEKDKAKAIEQMSGIYDPSLKYAPADLDLYSQALMEQGKLDEANKIFEKLAKDYAIPPNTEPSKASREIQEAQSVALFGFGKVLQQQNKIDEGKAKFDELEKLYGWSPKMGEANYGIALGLFETKAYDDALKRLLAVINSRTASAELRAAGMLLYGRINEDQGKFDAAIDNYIKVARLYTGVPDKAAEGLWRGAQLLEKQASGQLPMPKPSTPAPKKSGPPAKADKAAK